MKPMYDSTTGPLSLIQLLQKKIYKKLIYLSPNVDTRVEIFNSNLKHLFDLHVPLRMTTRKEDTIIWFLVPSTSTRTDFVFNNVLPLDVLKVILSLKSNATELDLMKFLRNF